MLRNIYRDTNFSQTLAPIKETITFSDIVISIQGVNDTGQTLALDDVGRVTYEKNGQTLIDADFEYLFYLADAFGGVPRFASATAGVVDIYLTIPRHLLDDNVEAVIPSDNAQIKITHPSAFDTALVSGTVSVSLDIAFGVQNYNQTMFQLTKDISGTGNIPFDVEVENIFLIAVTAKVSGALTTVGSNITRIRTEIEDLVGDGTLKELLGEINQKFKYETFTNKILIPYVAQGDITGKLSDNAKMTYDVSGASQVENLVLGAKFDLNRQKVSANAQRTRFRNLTERKIKQGKASTVEAINIISQ